MPESDAQSVLQQQFDGQIRIRAVKGFPFAGVVSYTEFGGRRRKTRLALCMDIALIITGILLSPVRTLGLE